MKTRHHQRLHAVTRLILLATMLARICSANPAGSAEIAVASSGIGSAPALAVTVDQLQTVANKVRIRDIGPEVVITHELLGDYAQHPVVIRNLLAYASDTYRGTGQLRGTYPDDPDAVGADKAKWSVGLVIRNQATAVGLPTPAAPYRLVEIPAVTVASLETTLPGSRTDGLALNAWLPLSGFVQVGPARMAYLDDKVGPNSRVRIEVPVRKRAWIALNN